MRIWGFIPGLIIGAGCAHASFPLPEATPAPTNAWSQVRSPSSGTPEAIGFYSNGCLRGARELPIEGEGYQVMRIDRNRHFAHPDLISFIETFSKTNAKLGSGLLIGDTAQARGGPLPWGHASHQLGLDADIWFWTHPEQGTRSLTEKERNTLPNPSMLDAKGRIDPARFGAEQIQKLKLAAADPKVERIFVNPAIKLYLCNNLDTEELFWLRKLRPWRGHHAHFHVRIQCPLDSKECVSQDPPPEGDGCQELSQASKKKVRLPRMPEFDDSVIVVV
ncbi:MAG: penicillin-insensitive murein endopeptidase, partial [Proteobacteria bacterium]|nr:penicillin-insensitive murein endopeptidase [Pseudomonadota bacterium]